MRCRDSVLIALLLAVACSPVETWQGTITERDGVVYVDNPRDGLWQSREPAPIRFELERVFGVELEPEEEILGAVGLRGVTVDGDGNVYVYDNQAHRLFSFDREGSLRWSAGREGQGPGEFHDAEGVAWDGERTIHVANAGQARLDLWSVDGEFIDSFSLVDQGLPTGTLLGFLDPGTIALETFASFNIGGRIGIVGLGPPARELADVTVDLTSTDTGRNFAFVSMATSGGFVTVGDVDSYELRFYERDGRLARVVSRVFPPMIGYAMAEAGGAVYSWLGPPFQLATGHWIVRSSWVDVADPDADVARRLADGTLADRPWRAAIDLFDAEGRFLYALVGDDLDSPIGGIQAVGPDGKVYTSVSDPFPQVRRYRVEIDEG